MSELSPEKINLLKQAVNAQERMLQGCTLVFRGLSDHHDPEVSSVAQECFAAIEHHQLVLEALVDALVETKH